jgi:hypothetical protein
VTFRSAACVLILIGGPLTACTAEQAPNATQSTLDRVDPPGDANTHRDAASNAPAPTTEASPTSDTSRVADVERTTSDGTRIISRELVGADVQEPGIRPMSADEIKEIERATGRQFEEGDTIYGRARRAEPR